MLVGATVVALIVVLYFYTANNTEIDDFAISEVSHPPASGLTHGTTEKATQTNFPTRKQHIAWTAIELDNNLPKSKWAHVPDHAVFVSLNDRFDQWLLDTPVEVHIPHINKTYNAIVDRITPNGPQSTTIRASPDAGEHDLKRLILTFGEDLTLAYVSTNQGSWELTGDDQIGWLVSTAELKRTQDYSQPDVINEHYDRYAGAEYVRKRNE